MLIVPTPFFKKKIIATYYFIYRHSTIPLVAVADIYTDLIADLLSLICSEGVPCGLNFVPPYFLN